VRPRPASPRDVEHSPGRQGVPGGDRPGRLRRRNAHVSGGDERRQPSAERAEDPARNRRALADSRLNAPGAAFLMAGGDRNVRRTIRILGIALMGLGVALAPGAARAAGPGAALAPSAARDAGPGAALAPGAARGAGPGAALAPSAALDVPAIVE